MTYQLHVSAVSLLVVIRLEYNVRETSSSNIVFQPDDGQLGNSRNI